MSVTYYRTLTVDHTKVPNTDQTDFPVLVALTHASFKTVGNGGKVEHASGYDIQFFSDINLTTLLNWEMVSFNAATGAVIAWVKIPTLSHATDTPFYMGYGDASVSTFQGSATSTWPSAFRAVYHLEGSPWDDSTANANHLSASGSVGTAAAQGAGLEATYASAHTSRTSSLTNIPNGPDNLTMVVTVKMNSTGGMQSIFGLLNFGASGGIQLTNRDAGPNLGVTQYGGGVTVGAQAPSVSTYYRIAYTWDGTTSKFYVDGALHDSTSTTPQTFTTTEIRVSTYNGSGEPIDGSADEARVLSGAMTADWLATEFNTTTSPSTFLSMSAESARPTIIISVTPSTFADADTGIAIAGSNM